MKRRLKGRSRYYPGCLYALLFSIPIWMIIFLICFKYLQALVESAVFMIILMIIAMIAYFLLWKAGEKIFDFTERKYLERCHDSKKAHTFAEITEFAVFFGIIILMTAIPLIIENSIDSTNSSSISENINGWD